MHLKPQHHTGPGSLSAHLLSLGKLPPHDALQDVSPYGYVEDISRQSVGPYFSAVPVVKRHLNPWRTCDVNAHRYALAASADHISAKHTATAK